MPHETELIATIAGGLTAAFLGGFAARRLGLPPIVGYLVAGLLVGPFTPGFVADPEVATELAEIGVILLMFGVGLHFSFRDLWSVRAIAVPGALVQSTTATLIGTLLGVAFGWGVLAGLVFGMSLSVASTVVLLRALLERRELDTSQGRIAVGWLIVEDLFTIAVLVILPALTVFTVAGGAADDADGALLEVAIALAKVAVLTAIMGVLGARVLPPLLLSVARDGSRELFTLAVLSASIGIAWVSYAVFGVSLALGAFLAGAVLAESDLSHQAASDALPLRDAFAVLFFVSVGMLVDPAVLLARPVEIALVLGLVLGGKSLAALGIVLLLGYPARVALTVSAGLAQVGEFTFILAALGLQLGMLPNEAFQLTVAAAVLSISLNPFIFGLTDRIEPWLRETPFARWALHLRGRGLETLGRPLPARSGRRHAILIGHGRVGSLVATALERRGFGYVVIDRDRRVVERLRARGVPALYGDAGDPEVLAEAGIEDAVVVVIAIADPTASAVAFERARQAAPRRDLVVRTHAERTASRLRAERGVWPIVGERELAVQMARVTLRRFGVSAQEVEQVAQGLRTLPPGPPTGGTGGRAVPLAAIAERLGRLRQARPVAGDRDAAPDGLTNGGTVTPGAAAGPTVARRASATRPAVRT